MAAYINGKNENWKCLLTWLIFVRINELEYQETFSAFCSLAGQLIADA